MTHFTNTLKGALIVASIIFFATLIGCKSKKVSIIDGSGDLKSKSHNQVIDDILVHELSYNTITTKGKISLNGKEFTAIFKLIKDDFMQVSIRPFIGIEVARVDISPEKMIIIDRFGKRYSETSFDDSGLSSLVAFNFYNLQALLTNKLFLAGNKQINKDNYSDFSIAVVDNNFILQTQDRNKLLYNFAVDALDRIVSTTISYPEKAMAIDWVYSDFVEDQQHLYPTNMTGNIKIKRKNIKVGVKYSTLDVDTNFNIDKSIPTKYEKIDLIKLINTYTKIK